MQLLEKAGFESKELKLSSLKQFDLSSHHFLLPFAFHLIHPVFFRCIDRHLSSLSRSILYLHTSVP